MLKLWVLGALLVGLAVPIRSGNPLVGTGAFLGGMTVLAMLIGVVESSMARLRLLRVPKLLVGATALAVLALILILG
jgi:formate hydrogenlyase subunit 4